MSSTKPRTPSTEELAQLTHLSSILHLLHHRNKNQHRRSPWYRHLSLFRRHLSALLGDFATLTTTPSTNLERTRLKALTPSLQARIAQRLTFWQDVLVARWMRAFSQVVADGRFSVLGLVMLGVLAGVCRVVGVADGLEAEGQREMEKALEEFGKEAWGAEREVGEVGEVVARQGGEEGVAVAKADEGEVVARRDEDEDFAGELDERGTVETRKGKPVPRDESEEPHMQNESEGMKVARPASPSPPKTTKPKTTSMKKRSADTKPKPAKKKRKKGGDAIDDLFSGL
ncbi:hypothetical protein Q7P37_005317 [Cladosporium fusiforme]